MSLVEFEKHGVVKDFMNIFDVYYTNLGGYHYSKDGSPCYYLNGMLTMFEEQQKKIDTLKAKVQELWTELDERQSKEHIIERCESIIQELLKE